MQARSSFQVPAEHLSLVKLLKNWSAYKQRVLRTEPGQESLLKLMRHLDSKLLDVKQQVKEEVLLTFCLIDQNYLHLI